jgi:transcriptional regulator with XRE-family HTH domain
MTIGRAIIAARKRIGMSQKDLAASVLKEDGIPISAPYLNDIEHDRRNPPSPHLLREFARVLDLSYEYLLFLSGELPDDVRRDTDDISPEDVEAAFQSFRRTLRERSGPEPSGDA